MRLDYFVSIPYCFISPPLFFLSSAKVDGVLLAERLIADAAADKSKINGLQAREMIPRHHLTPDPQVCGQPMILHLVPGKFIEECVMWSNYSLKLFFAFWEGNVDS